MALFVHYFLKLSSFAANQHHDPSVTVWPHALGGRVAPKCPGRERYIASTNLSLIFDHVSGRQGKTCGRPPRIDRSTEKGITRGSKCSQRVAAGKRLHIAARLQ